MDASPARAIRRSEPIDVTPARAIHLATPKPATPARASTEQTLDLIQSLGSMLDDLQRVRIANDNRVRALEQRRGDALPHLRVLAASLTALEHEANLELCRAWRRHPLAPWAKTVTGLGEKSIARLVAIVGDPADRPNPAKLWAYCGHGDPARNRMPRNPSQAELFRRGNPHAKRQVWVIASQFRIHRDSRYRLVYEQARERYAGRVHQAPCIRCGPAGRPAAAGTPWALGHQDAAAVRYVGKQFLRELWEQARALRAQAAA